MTYGATRFVTPLAFRSITHREVVTDTYDVNSEFANEHVALAPPRRHCGNRAGHS